MLSSTVSAHAFLAGPTLPHSRVCGGQAISRPFTAVRPVYPRRATIRVMSAAMFEAHVKGDPASNTLGDCKYLSCPPLLAVNLAIVRPSAAHTQWLLHTIGVTVSLCSILQLKRNQIDTWCLALNLTQATQVWRLWRKRRYISLAAGRPFLPSRSADLGAQESAL